MKTSASETRAGEAVATGLASAKAKDKMTKMAK